MRDKVKKRIKALIRSVFDWFADSEFLTPIRTQIIIVGLHYISRAHGFVTYFEDNRRNIFDLVVQMRKEIDMQMSQDEAATLVMAVRNTKKIQGDIAEVGVYVGGSAKLICYANQEQKMVHLFDTFEGLPDVDDGDQPGETYLHKGKFAASLKAVKDYLQAYSNIRYYKGIFPSSGRDIRDKVFSFVHLDVDTYRSTKESLTFFYPRLEKGAILISHDYRCLPGVRTAMDEFMRDKPEPLVEIANSQCLFVKV